MDFVAILSLALSLVGISIASVCYVLLKKQISSDRIGMEEENLTVDVGAVVREFGERLKRLEREIVDQKVKAEILQMRLPKVREKPTSFDEIVSSPSSSVSKVLPSELSAQVGRRPKSRLVLRGDNTRAILAMSKVMSTIDGNNASSTGITRNSGTVRHVELEALRIVAESGAKGITAKEVESRIGRSREHTARMMNGLFQKGLVNRDATLRPFKYVITEKGRREI
jgi:DNA-binding MarR family transcriptional regulator